MGYHLCLVLNSLLFWYAERVAQWTWNNLVFCHKPGTLLKKTRSTGAEEATLTKVMLSQPCKLWEAGLMALSPLGQGIGIETVRMMRQLPFHQIAIRLKGEPNSCQVSP